LIAKNPLRYTATGYSTFAVRGVERCGSGPMSAFPDTSSSGCVRTLPRGEHFVKRMHAGEEFNYVLLRLETQPELNQG
jgi:hypothetical protein